MTKRELGFLLVGLGTGLMFAVAVVIGLWFHRRSHSHIVHIDPVCRSGVFVLATDWGRRGLRQIRLQPCRKNLLKIDYSLL
jgi:hypothetical protein